MSQNFFKKIAVSSSIGAGIGILFSSLLVFIMAFILTVGNVPAMLISPITVLFLAVGGFLGGFFSAKSAGEKGLLCGSISGLIFFFIAWIAGAVFESSGIGMAAVIKAVMVVIASSFGGIIGVNYIKRK